MSPSRSKKRKQKREKERQHRRQQEGEQTREQERKPLEAFRQKLARGPWRGMKTKIMPGRGPKMSAVLLDFVEPYTKYADTDEAYRKLLTLAVMAWNASLMPAEERRRMIDSVLNAGIPGGTKKLKADLKKLVEELIARKEAHFGQYTQMIVDFQLQDTDEGLHLSVASASMQAPSS